MSVRLTQTQDAAVAALRQYIDAFNQGDPEAMAACFAVQGTIGDGMPPHLRQGSTAARDWYGDVLIEGEHSGASDYHMTLGPPLHADVTGDAVYLVSPATMTFKLQGKQVTQLGALFTTALRRVAEDWRIADLGVGKGPVSDVGREVVLPPSAAVANVGSSADRQPRRERRLCGAVLATTASTQSGLSAPLAVSG